MPGRPQRAKHPGRIGGYTSEAIPRAFQRLAVDTFRVCPSGIVCAGNAPSLINSYALSEPIPSARAAVTTLTAAGRDLTSSTDIPPRRPSERARCTVITDEDKGGHIPLPRATWQEAYGAQGGIPFATA